MNKAKQKSSLRIIFLVSLMSVLGLTTIQPAFPRIIEQLGVSADRIGLIITVFVLPGLILTPIMGVLADRFGRKRILIPSLLLFGITGFLCTLARDFEALLVFRFFEGIGAAALGAINITLIGDIFSGRERVATMGYNAGVLSIGTATFPFIGGLLASIDWYYGFYLALLAIPVGIVALFLLNNSEVKTKSTLSDYFRNALACMKNRRVITILTTSFISYFILFGAFQTYIPILVKQNNALASPLFIGIVLSAMSAVTAIVSPLLKRLTVHIRLETLLKTAFLLYSIGLVSLIFCHFNQILFFPAFIYGVAQAFFLPVTHSLLAAETVESNRAGIMSFNRMIAQVGQASGPAIMGIMYAFAGNSLPVVFLAGGILSLAAFIFVSVRFR